MKKQKGGSLLTKRSIFIAGRKRTIYLEYPFWGSLREIADTNGVKVRELLNRIYRDRCTPNLSSAIRLFILDHYVTLTGKQKTKND